MIEEPVERLSKRKKELKLELRSTLTAPLFFLLGGVELLTE